MKQSTRVVMKKIVPILGLIISIITVFYVQSSNDASHKADLVIFSFDRPLQLYALLESVEKYLLNVNDLHVIYRASDAAFNEGYQKVATRFGSVVWHKQGEHPAQDFKPLTLQAAFESPASYVVFAVDDIVLKDTISLHDCIAALEKYNAYGFFLRLGTNLDQCYSYGSAHQPLPPFTQEEENLLSWQFNQGRFDWNYPHTVDMTVYRKKDIESDYRLYSYHTPNKLEDIWNMRSHAIKHKRGLCYAQSMIVNMPLNRVQHEYNNRAMQEYTPLELLKLFLQGKKMDIAPLYRIKNRAAHMEYSPSFINQ